MTKLSKETQEAVRAIVADDDCYIVTEQDQPVSVRTLGGQYWEISFGRWSAFYDEKDMIPEDIETMQRAADETAGRLPARETTKTTARDILNSPVLLKSMLLRDPEPRGESKAPDVVVRYYTGNTRIQQGGPFSEIQESDGTRDGRRVFRWHGERDCYGRRVFVEEVGSRGSLRGAMEAMSNVARQLQLVMYAAWQEDCYEQAQRNDRPYTSIAKDFVSKRWSEKVRDGVKALKPPGPIVSCQGDWEED